MGGAVGAGEVDAARGGVEAGPRAAEDARGAREAGGLAVKDATLTVLVTPEEFERIRRIVIQAGSWARACHGIREVIGEERWRRCEGHVVGFIPTDAPPGVVRWLEPRAEPS